MFLREEPVGDAATSLLAAVVARGGALRLWATESGLETLGAWGVSASEVPHPGYGFTDVAWGMYRLELNEGTVPLVTSRVPSLFDLDDNRVRGLYGLDAMLPSAQMAFTVEPAHLEIWGVPSRDEFLSWGLGGEFDWPQWVGEGQGDLWALDVGHALGQDILLSTDDQGGFTAETVEILRKALEQGVDHGAPDDVVAAACAATAVLDLHGAHVGTLVSRRLGMTTANATLVCPLRDLAEAVLEEVARRLHGNSTEFGPDLVSELDFVVEALQKI